MAVTHNSILRPAPEQTTRADWLGWGAAMTVIYALLSFAGWGRTLLEDEIWSLHHGERSLIWLLRYLRGDLVHPPLWYLLASWWTKLFGLSDAAAKSLPLIFNIPALLLFPRLAQSVTQHWRLAALLFAAVYWRIGGVMWLARMHGLLVLLAILALFLWERWRREPGIGVLTAWAGVMVLMVYTHYAGLLLLGAFVVADWFYGPRPELAPLSLRWSFVFMAGFVALTMVPWLLYVWPVFETRGLEHNLGWVRSPHVVLGQLPFFFLSYIHPGFNPFDELRELPPVNVRVVAYLLASGAHLALAALAWHGFRRGEIAGAEASRVREWLGPLAVLVMLPIAVLYAFSVVVHPALDPRFLLVLLPAYWLLLVLAAEAGGEGGRWMLFGIVLPWVLLSVAVTLPAAGSSPVRLAVEAVAAQHRPGDLLMAECRAGVNVWWEWTHRLGRTEELQAFGCQRWRWWVKGVSTPKDEELLLDGVKRVWFVFVREEERERLEAVLTGRGFLRVPVRGPRFLALYARSEASVSTSWTVWLSRSRPERIAVSSASTTATSNLLPTHCRMRCNA